MTAPDEPEGWIATPGGKFAPLDHRLQFGDREWSALHARMVLTTPDEVRMLVQKTNGVPYGVALWPGGIALAHEVAERPGDFAGRSVLELGAGTGLAGIVAASHGARVLQTDHDEVALDLCRRNGVRNGIANVEYRLADWTEWDVAGRFDWILGADVLYVEERHPDLRRVFEANLAPGGRILIADPFRAMSLRLMATLEAEGWRITSSRWDVGEDETRPVGVFELTPPAPPA